MKTRFQKILGLIFALGLLTNPVFAETNPATYQELSTILENELRTGRFAGLTEDKFQKAFHKYLFIELTRLRLKDNPNKNEIYQTLTIAAEIAKAGNESTDKAFLEKIEKGLIALNNGTLTKADAIALHKTLTLAPNGEVSSALRKVLQKKYGITE